MPSNTAITAGITITASDQVTKTLTQISTAMERFKGSVGKAQESLKNSLSIGKPAQMSFPFMRTPAPPPEKKESDIEVKGTGFSGLAKAADNYSDGIEKVMRTMRNFTLLLVGAGGMTYGLKQFSENVSHSVVDMAALEKRTLLPSREIMRLGYVAKASGSSIDALRGALVSVSDLQGDAKFHLVTEGVKAIQALNTVSKKPISLLDQNGTRRNLSAVVGDVLSSLQRVRDPSLRARIATQIFGNDEMLKLAGPQFEGLMKHFSNEGISQDAAQQANNYLVSITDLDKALEHLKFTAGIDILNGFSEGLRNSSRVLEENHDRIEKLSKDLGASLPGAVQTGFKGLQVLTDSFGFVDKTIGAANFTLLTFTTYLTAKTVVGINNLRKAIEELQALSLVSTIFGLTESMAAGFTAFAASPLSIAAPVVAAGLVLRNPLTKDIIEGKYTGGIRPNFSANDFGLKLGSKNDEKPSSQDGFSAQTVAPETLIRLVFENAPSSLKIIEKRGSAPILTELGLNLPGAR